jgi:hypothetical protein
MAAMKSIAKMSMEAIWDNMIAKILTEGIQDCICCTLLEGRFLQLNTHALEKAFFDFLKIFRY